MSAEMDDFRLACRTIDNFNADARFDRVETLPTSRAGIDEKHSSEPRNSFDLEDMTVTADKSIRLVLLKDRSDSVGPLPGISTDVCHQKAHSADGETLKFRRTMPNIPAIDISIYGFYRRPDGFQFIQNVRCADISGVENQIADGECFMRFGVKPAVGIRNNPKSHDQRTVKRKPRRVWSNRGP